jgi:hypothetical protein
VSNQRQYLRLGLDDQPINAAFRLADGSYGEFRLTGRNVSRGGVAVLAPNDVAAETPCNVVLPTRNGEMLAVRGRVRRTRSVGADRHEIGIQFDEPIDASAFGELLVRA